PGANPAARGRLLSCGSPGGGGVPAGGGGGGWGGGGGGPPPRPPPRPRGERPNFAAGVMPPVFVPESLTGMELLENFRASAAHMAIVVDEYGEIQGLVTPQDLLEAIAGEFKTPSVDDAWAIQRQDGSWLLDGLIPIPELKDRLGLDAVPEEEHGRYNTLSGMLMLLLGRLPHTGDVVNWQDWRFEIIDMDGRRIDKVLATRAAARAP
ncbi:MAG: transporter associated domain-containing protein, partial [Sutterellaceae bacterium]|nr:CBS domain-containing protein [Burkholderiaceae bacterium]MDW8430050.1 transporter associated domain-containing protein [Sutterellaceae bacterium]